MNIRMTLSRWWRTLFPLTIKQYEQIYCSICDGRIWFWQRGVRVYSLGMTRAHITCAADYLRAELQAQHIALKSIADNIKQIREHDKWTH